MPTEEELKVFKTLDNVALAMRSKPSRDKVVPFWINIVLEYIFPLKPSIFQEHTPYTITIDDTMTSGWLTHKSNSERTHNFLHFRFIGTPEEGSDFNWEEHEKALKEQMPPRSSDEPGPNNKHVYGLIGFGSYCRFYELMTDGQLETLKVHDRNLQTLHVVHDYEDIIEALLEIHRVRTYCWVAAELRHGQLQYLRNFFKWLHNVKDKA